MKVGIQLYSVRNSMAQAPIETIEKVVAAGYKYLEVANHNALQDSGVGFGVSAQEMRRLLQDTGAKIIGAHIEPIDLGNIDRVLEYHSEIGSEYLCESMSFYRNREEVLQKAQLMNQLSEKCKAAGLYLCFHNHFHEFQTFDGQTVFDLLMQNTSQEVAVELDTYWVMRAGVDPQDIMKQYGRRIRLVHQKDYTKGLEGEMNSLQRIFDSSGRNAYIDMEAFNQVGNPDTFTEIGTGLMKIQDIIETANQFCHSDYIILEQDHSKLEELESIQVSMEHFKKYSGISWQ